MIFFQQYTNYRLDNLAEPKIRYSFAIAKAGYREGNYSDIMDTKLFEVKK